MPVVEVMRGFEVKEETMKKTGTVSLLAMVCCLLWGSAFPSIKVGYSLFQIGSGDTASQILFAGCRFALAGVLVIVIGSALQGKLLKPSKAAIPKIAKVCLMQTVIQYFFFYVGLAHTTGVKGSIVEASNVFLAILISSLIFRQEKLKGKKIVGCLIGFGGVVLINISGGSVELGFNFMGDGFIFISAIAYALSSAYIKKYSQTENPVMISGYQFLAGGMIMIAGGLAAGGRFGQFNGACAGILLYMASISAVAYTLWGVLLKYNPVSRVSVFGFMNPVFGVLLSAVILGEGSAFGLKGIVALLLVCAGIFIVNAERSPENPECARNGAN